MDGEYNCAHSLPCSLSCQIFFRCLSLPSSSSKITSEMGQRHNRKRTRHRLLRCQRPGLDSKLSARPVEPLTTALCIPTEGSERLAAVVAQPSLLLAGFDLLSNKTSFGAPRSPFIIPESSAMRNQRLFGSLGPDDDLMEFCAPMLDVVLSLFGALDYDEGLR
jgi:hypothetical protein